MTILTKSRTRLNRKWAECISLDQVYIRYLESMHKIKKHIWEKDRITFGQFCDLMKADGYRII